MENIWYIIENDDNYSLPRSACILKARNNFNSRATNIENHGATLGDYLQLNEIGGLCYFVSNKSIIAMVVVQLVLNDYRHIENLFTIWKQIKAFIKI